MSGPTVEMTLPDGTVQTVTVGAGDGSGAPVAFTMTSAGPEPSGSVDVVVVDAARNRSSAAELKVVGTSVPVIATIEDIIVDTDPGLATTPVDVTSHVSAVDGLGADLHVRTVSVTLF